MNFTIEYIKTQIPFLVIPIIKHDKNFERDTSFKQRYSKPYKKFSSWDRNKCKSRLILAGKIFAIVSNLKTHNRRLQELNHELFKKIISIIINRQGKTFSETINIKEKRWAGRNFSASA